MEIKKISKSFMAKVAVPFPNNQIRSFMFQTQLEATTKAKNPEELTDDSEKLHEICKLLTYKDMENAQKEMPEGVRIIGED